MSEGLALMGQAQEHYRAYREEIKSRILALPDLQ
jgi:hypothetical protein